MASSPLLSLSSANSTLLRDLRTEFREIGMLTSMADQRRRADVLSVATRSASSSHHGSPIFAPGSPLQALADSPDVRASRGRAMGP